MQDEVVTGRIRGGIIVLPLERLAAEGAGLQEMSWMKCLRATW